MSQNAEKSTTLDQFGNSFERVERAINAFRKGIGILVVDDEDRENEGDLIFAAETLTKEQMAMLIRECSGIVCLCLTNDHAAKLDLPPMVAKNSSSMGTAFTVSIEAKEDVTTGVSAADRTQTVKTAIRENCQPTDLARPGHIFPLIAADGGVITRRGHTEATIDLCKLAECFPAGVLCELTNRDGTMARLPEVIDFGRKHGFPVVSIEDLCRYRARDIKQAV